MSADLKTKILNPPSSPRKLRGDREGLRAFNLEREALLASGIREECKILFYLSELDRILQQFLFQTSVTHDPVQKARALFAWLWTSKPFRYKPRGNYKLSEAIEAQLSEESKSVGNCLGLTILYNSLLRRMGIIAGALYLENAFGMGPHVSTLLQTEESLMDVENILPDGFDYKGHLTAPARTRWEDRELIADIYLSVGNELFERGDFVEALENYEKAIAFNPEYEKARLNRVILLDKIGEWR